MGHEDRIPPNSKRIRKCCLRKEEHKSTSDIEQLWTDNLLDHHTTEMLKAFVDVLKEQKQLELLYIDSPWRKAALLKPLESLQGIHRVEILPDWVRKEPSRPYRRRLRTLMMSNGDCHDIDDIPPEDVEKNSDLVTRMRDGGKEDREFQEMKTA